MTIPCFMIEPTSSQRRWLRRFRSGAKASLCSGPLTYHDGKAKLDEIDAPLFPEGGALHEPRHEWLRDDPRWPTHCEACGERFTDADPWQVYTERIWARTDNGARYTIRETPAGAMWNAWWLTGVADYRGDDGLSLCVKMPDGTVWQADCPGLQNSRWKRTGTPPQISVTPSIATAAWHGSLVNGVLA